jgi:hypothetical protein
MYLLWSVENENIFRQMHFLHTFLTIVTALFILLYDFATLNAAPTTPSAPVCKSFLLLTVYSNSYMNLVIF